jgi:hypothetical protein
MRLEDSGRRHLFQLLDGSTLSGVHDFRRGKIVPVGKIMGAGNIQNYISFQFQEIIINQFLLDIGRSNRQWHSSSFFEIAIVHDEPGQFGRPSCALKTIPQNLIKFN